MTLTKQLEDMGFSKEYLKRLEQLDVDTRGIDVPVFSNTIDIVMTQDTNKIEPTHFNNSFETNVIIRKH